ncbi:MAG: hypothetical protein ACI8TP_000601 [Acidimicrobiales bacterium]|jgi:hypothetical protein
MKPGKTIALTFGVGLMLISTGCSASDGSESAGSAVTVPSTTVMATPPATTALATTTSTTMDEIAAVLAAVEGFNTAFAVASRPYDPEHPLLDRFTTGELRERLRESFTLSAADGDTVVGDYLVGDDISVTIRNDGTALVEACTQDETVRLSTNGDVLSAAEDQATLFYTVLTLGIDGAWRVSEEGYVDGTPQACDL